jgi:antitoxin Phd
MGSWQLQEAKAKLSEVIDTAEKLGPQIITRRGVETAVVVPIEEWKRMQPGAKRTLLEILQSGPKSDLPIPPRGRTKHREPVIF